MKNVVKVMTALKNAFPGHRVEYIYYPEKDTDRIFVDGTFVADFDDDFFEHDYDDIELTIRAPLVSIKDFTKRAVGYEIIRAAVERGFAKWENESHPNN